MKHSSSSSSAKAGVKPPVPPKKATASSPVARASPSPAAARVRAGSGSGAKALGSPRDPPKSTVKGKATKDSVLPPLAFEEPSEEEVAWGDEAADLGRVLGPFEASGDNIRVAVRVRPPNDRELAGGEGGGVCVGVEGSVVVATGHESTPFGFDLVLPMASTQLDVFAALGVDLVACAHHGFNASLFAYGQTSSGKSYSMMGVPGTAQIGLVPRTVHLLFASVAAAKASSGAASKEMLVEASYLEIYNEKLRDLLGDARAQEKLKVRESKALGVHVLGLTRAAVASEAEALGALELGTRQRTTAATLYNTESSRSHSVFELNVQSRYVTAAGEMRSTSRLSLIDLAGSERSEKLGSTGRALVEGNNINKSLTVLGRCIRALVGPAKDGAHISPPFRDSVLTFYLRDALAGNSRTTMLAAVSPVHSNIEETLSTLRYAASAKNIKTAARKNEDPAQAKIRELSSEIESLRARLAAVEAGGAPLLSSHGGHRKSLVALEHLEQTMLAGGFDQAQAAGRKLMSTRRASLAGILGAPPLGGGGGQGGDSGGLPSTSGAAPGFPLLSCLNQDAMLSHALTLPLATLPFAVGRDEGSDPMRGEHFLLHGMGIAPRHCVFEAVPGGGVAVRPTDSHAEVLVNGRAVSFDREGSSHGLALAHGDRVVLGPCRLVALFLVRPLTPLERKRWAFDDAFAEVAGNGSSAASDSPARLLSPSRAALASAFLSAEAGPVAQANMIAVEMGSAVRFEPLVVFAGSGGLSSGLGAGLGRPGCSLDDFFEANKPSVKVACVVSSAGAPIATAAELAEASNRFLRARAKERKARQQASPASPGASGGGSAAPSPALSSPRPGSRASPRTGTAAGFDLLKDPTPSSPKNTLFDPRRASQIQFPGSPLCNTLDLSGDLSGNLSGAGDGVSADSADGADKATLFELCLDDFEEVVSALKASHASFLALSGGLSEAGNASTAVSSRILRVFNELDADRSNTIDRAELANGLRAFNVDSAEAPATSAFVETVLAEEGMPVGAKGELDYGAFERFLIRFLQHQFLRCIEAFVSAHDRALAGLKGPHGGLHGGLHGGHGWVAAESLRRRSSGGGFSRNASMNSMSSAIAAVSASASFYNDYHQPVRCGTCVFIIDPQKDFHPGGSLAIPTADDDSKRIADMIMAHGASIDDVIVSLDTHQKLHVAHPLFWVDASGKHPAPFTPITVEAVEAGDWRTTDPRWRAWGLKYVKTLAANRRFVLLVWPEHCVVGTSGHAVVDSVNSSLHRWCFERKRAVEWVIKGHNMLTEHYSAMRADVLCDDDPRTHFNQPVFDRLRQASRVVVCGEALSHCVAFTLRDLVSQWPKDEVAKLVLLTDCASAVPGFEKAAADFVAEMRAAGVTVTTSDAIDWSQPGDHDEI